MLAALQSILVCLMILSIIATIMIALSDDPVVASLYKMYKMNYDVSKHYNSLQR